MRTKVQIPQDTYDAPRLGKAGRLRPGRWKSKLALAVGLGVPLSAFLAAGPAAADPPGPPEKDTSSSSSSDTGGDDSGDGGTEAGDSSSGETANSDSSGSETNGGDSPSSQAGATSSDAARDSTRSVASSQGSSSDDAMATREAASFGGKSNSSTGTEAVAASRSDNDGFTVSNNTVGDRAIEKNFGSNDDKPVQSAAAPTDSNTKETAARDAAGSGDTRSDSSTPGGFRQKQEEKEIAGFDWSFGLISSAEAADPPAEVTGDASASAEPEPGLFDGRTPFDPNLLENFGKEPTKYDLVVEEQAGPDGFTRTESYYDADLTMLEMSRKVSRTTEFDVDENAAFVAVRTDTDGLFLDNVKTEIETGNNERAIIITVDTTTYGLDGVQEVRQDKTVEYLSGEIGGTAEVGYYHTQTTPALAPVPYKGAVKFEYVSGRSHAGGSAEIDSDKGTIYRWPFGGHLATSSAYFDLDLGLVKDVYSTGTRTRVNGGEVEQTEADGPYSREEPHGKWVMIGDSIDQSEMVDPPWKPATQIRKGLPVYPRYVQVEYLPIEGTDGHVQTARLVDYRDGSNPREVIAGPNGVQLSKQVHVVDEDLFGRPLGTTWTQRRSVGVGGGYVSIEDSDLFERRASDGEEGKEADRTYGMTVNAGGERLEVDNGSASFESDGSGVVDVQIETYDFSDLPVARELQSKRTE